MQVLRMEEAEEGVMGGYDEMERVAREVDRQITKRENDKHHDIGVLKEEKPNDNRRQTENIVPR